MNANCRPGLGHVVCHESDELQRTSENGFEIQLLTCHVDCAIHTHQYCSNATAVSQALESDQKCCGDCSNKHLTLRRYCDGNSDKSTRRGYSFITNHSKTPEKLLWLQAVLV
jgi:hypothetical protein